MLRICAAQVDVLTRQVKMVSQKAREDKGHTYSTISRVCISACDERPHVSASSSDEVLSASNTYEDIFARTVVSGLLKLMILLC